MFACNIIHLSTGLRTIASSLTEVETEGNGLCRGEQ
jgi:hypothetical protein